MKPENVKFCECGCGHPTRLAAKTSARFGWVQGKPLRFILGHRKTHGHTSNRRSAEYIAWCAMRKRCLPDWPKHHLYYDRGIAVCPRWRDDFAAFLSDMGPRPAGHQLDRIDNRKGYEPGNVRWADLLTQRRNQRPRRPYGPRRQDPRWATPENPAGARIP